MMLWMGLLLVLVGAAFFVMGFVLYADATGVAPPRRTSDDRTGVKRAAARVEWSDVFRRIPSSFSVILHKDADRSDRRAAVASLAVLAGVLAVGAGVLASLASLL